MVNQSPIWLEERRDRREEVDSEASVWGGEQLQDKMRKAFIIEDLP